MSTIYGDKGMVEVCNFFLKIPSTSSETTLDKSNSNGLMTRGTFIKGGLTLAVGLLAACGGNIDTMSLDMEGWRNAFNNDPSLAENLQNNKLFADRVIEEYAATMPFEVDVERLKGMLNVLPLEEYIEINGEDYNPNVMGFVDAATDEGEIYISTINNVMKGRKAGNLYLNIILDEISSAHTIYGPKSYAADVDLPIYYTDPNGKETIFEFTKVDGFALKFQGSTRTKVIIYNVPEEAMALIERRAFIEENGLDTEKVGTANYFVAQQILLYFADKNNVSILELMKGHHESDLDVLLQTFLGSVNHDANTYIKLFEVNKILDEYFTRNDLNEFSEDYLISRGVDINAIIWNAILEIEVKLSE